MSSVFTHQYFDGAPTVEASESGKSLSIEHGATGFRMYLPIEDAVELRDALSKTIVECASKVAEVTP